MNSIKKNYIDLVIFFYFFVFFVIGLITAKDYGIHIEEKFHRSNGFYWLNYLLSFTNLDQLKDVSLDKYNKIYDYTLSQVSHYNKYGIIFDVPAALLELLLKIDEPKKYYQLRHLLSFIFFFIGSVFFFKILMNRFKKKDISLIGTSFYILSPRIYGDSFLYKDIIFLSISTISIYFFFKVIDKFSYKNIIFFALSASAATSARIIGIYFPIILVVLFLIEILNKKGNKEYLIKNLLFLLFFFFFLIIQWPYLWQSPFNNFLLLFNSLKTDLISVKILFDEKFISNEFMPLNYLHTWIFISTPPLHTILFCLGYFYLFKRFLFKFLNIENKSKFDDFWHSKNEKKDFTILITFTSIFIFIIIQNIKLYNGWRLVYFLNIFLVYIITYFLYLFFFKIKSFKKKTFFYLVLIIIFSMIIQKMIVYHPFQSLYFNSLITKKAKNSYEGDYHGLGGSKFLFEISKDNSEIINIAVASHTPLQRSKEFIDIELGKFINIVGQEYYKADYIYKNNISEVNSYLNKKYDIPNDFIKIEEFIIDGISIYEIYKKTIK